MQLILPPLTLLVLLFAGTTLAQAPVVSLDDATVTGSASGAVHKFLGIPFAKPPVGDLRFNHPVAVDAYAGAINASTYGPACPQQVGTPMNIEGLPPATLQFLAGGGAPIVGQEDCLSINVVKPNVTTSTPLPVVVWIYGGGFEYGASQSYDGGMLVERSIAMEQPIVFVSMNYRLSAFGFLPGKEVKEAGVGNVGLLDQRLALRWVQKYIAEFGGDATKVTIWGESAGAISVAFQMLMNGGDAEGLFRGAFMQSGSHLPVGGIEDWQQYYDAIVANTTCSQAQDTLKCLRTLPYDDLKTAIDEHTPFIFDYQALILAYMPRTDGTMFTQDPMRLVAQGKFANVPVVSGDCDDEGTLFSLSQRNITTDADMKTYVQDTLFPQVPECDIDTILELYPDTLSAGSPFDTADANGLTPQFKRIASILGDFVFQAPRRFFLAALAKKQSKIYTYISKREKAVPYVGSFHTSDTALNSFYPGGDMQDYIIRFTVSLDPNGATDSEPAVVWPLWSPASPQMLSFNDGEVPLDIAEDTYREEPMKALNRILYKYPV